MAEVIVTNENFEEEVLQSTIPVLVDFWAAWCMPCRMLAPVVEKIANDHAGEVKVCKCNIDENMELAERYRVMSIPTVACFKNGEISKISVGVVGESELEALFL